VYSTEDADLIKELARRIAIAVDNAWLYAEAQAGIRLRDQFLSIASHEIKTPLTALLGNANLFARRVKREGQLTERNQQTLQIVIRQAERLNRLITMLFDLSRIQLNRLQIELVPLDLRALVQRIVEEVQIQLDSHRFEIKGMDQPLIVSADELRLEQVLQNLFGNAVKYSPQGGVIEVLLEQREAYAYMHVTDQGIGIPAAAIPHLFRRFYRAGNTNTHRISGLGIGLYVTREILAQHHGTIEITSVEGQGSTFSIALPLCSEEALAERAK
jgi:signal transduction histidine kinase